jgi:hypothetical protein
VFSSPLLPLFKGELFLSLTNHSPGTPGLPFVCGCKYHVSQRFEKFIYIETGLVLNSVCRQAALELSILLPQLPQFWYYRHVQPRPAVLTT